MRHLKLFLGSLAAAAGVVFLLGSIGLAVAAIHEATNTSGKRVQYQGQVEACEAVCDPRGGVARIPTEHLRPAWEEFICVCLDGSAREMP